jgi:predicted SnoaL-like aldol condensation-catalyzing enzyme
MSKKESAVSFLKMAGTGNVQEAFERFIAPDFIHHNLYFKGDRHSLMTAMAEAHKASPNKLIDVKRVIEEGDTVVTHSLVVRQSPSEQDVSVVHIFRFKGDKVVELWDVGMLLDKSSPNEYGAF